MQKDREEKLVKLLEERNQKQREDAEDSSKKSNDVSSTDERHGSAEDKNEGESAAEGCVDEKQKPSDADQDVVEAEDETTIGKDGKKHTIVTRSKTGSLQPRTFNMEDLKRRSLAPLSKEEQEKLEKSLKEESDSTRLTRQKAHQIASGTHLFKLGMDNTFKTYVNQYTTNQIALNKAQRNEERDKRRHLSHKFSLTQVHEFKWIGSLTGTRALLVSTLRQTILQLESNIQTPFMHTNWPLLRKPWTTAVSTCVNARDFSKTLMVLQACIKSVVFAGVWHDQLGHVKLQRVTALEREEKKKIEKREKKEKEDEEERNRYTSNFVKFTLGLKHQVYKQKGEEYRLHGQWGWLWMSVSRKVKHVDPSKQGLRAGPQKMLAQIKDGETLKILALDPPTYEHFMREYSHLTDSQKDNKDAVVKREIKTEDQQGLNNGQSVDPEKSEEKGEVKEGGGDKDVKMEEGDSAVKSEEKEKEKENADRESSKPNLSFLSNLNITKVIGPTRTFEETIDVTKALTSQGRVHYPKVGKKCRIDEFLTRRTHLKSLEERRLLQLEKPKPQVAVAVAAAAKASESEAEVDVVNNEEAEQDKAESTLQSILPGKTINKSLTAPAREMLNVIGRRIQQVRTQYASTMKLGKGGTCYSKYCNMSSLPGKNLVTAQSLVSTCYSPICLQKARLKRELITLLRKANVLNNNQPSQVAVINTTTGQIKKIIMKPAGMVEDAKKIAAASAAEAKKPEANDATPPAKRIKLSTPLVSFPLV